MKRTMKMLLAGGAGLFMALSTAEAAAATYEVCLRIPVTITDETGEANDIGLDGNWVARGIRVSYVKAPNGTQVAGFPKYAGASDGCFTFTSAQSGDFEIGIQPRGMLAASNELQVLSAAGNLVTYAAVLNITSSTGTYAWPQEPILPRMYAIFAYAIQSGFRGNYNDELLVVHYDATSPCSSKCNTACSQNGVSHVSMCTGSTQRKFVMGHEYGHSNLARSISFVANNDVGYNETPATRTHSMRSIEFSSGAAMEGWANFISAEVWNGPGAGSDPPAWLRYWGFGGALVDVEGAQGGCSVTGSDGTNFRRGYADACHQGESACADGNCLGLGVELDWMRMWWDFYEDPDMPGTPPSPSDLHAMIDAAGPWSAQNVWQTLRASLSGDQLSRFDEASVWNGVSEQ